MRLFQKLAVAAAGVAVFTWIEPLPIKAMETSASITCSDNYLPVSLVPGEPTQYEVFGQLCGQSPLNNKTVQVLVSGATYDHNYWNLSYQSERYSYVKALTQAGYTTFAIDGIGVGNSSHPPGNRVTLDSDAYVVHQVIQSLRDGEVNGESFQKIELVGHSLGSLVAISEVSKYNDVNGVILTGFLHNLNPDVPTKFADAFYPAQLDPRIALQNLPSGYLTTKPGLRSQLYYNITDTDTQVISLDEATKGTIATGENASGGAIFSNASEQIHVPVLEVVGQNDGFYCSSTVCNSSTNVAQNEASYFSPLAHLATFVLPEAGHVINLHLNASEWYEMARQWSDKSVGREVNILTPGPEPNYGLGVLTLATLGTVTVLKRSL